MSGYEYINSTGVILADTADIRDEVAEEYTAANGSDFNTDSTTIAGREISAKAQARADVMRSIAHAGSQINPSYATGIWLDAICALTGTSRDSAERSSVVCTLTGTSGTLIPSGYRIRDDEDNLWMNSFPITIPSGGSIDASFLSVETGEIDADSGTVTTIVDSVLGWTGVTNDNSAIVGQDKQSNQSLRLERVNGLGSQSGNTAATVIANVTELENVRSVSFRENPSDASDTIDGITMAAHSTYLCCEGGDDQDVAEAYYKGRCATPFATSTTVVSQTVEDETSGQELTVEFSRPDTIDIEVEITVKIDTSTTLSVTDVEDIILEYSDGELDGEDGLFIGSDVSPFEIASAVNVGISNVFVTDCKVAIVGDTLSAETIEIGIDEVASIESSNITVTFP